MLVCSSLLAIGGMCHALDDEQYFRRGYVVVSMGNSPLSNSRFFLVDFRFVEVDMLIEDLIDAEVTVKISRVVVQIETEGIPRRQQEVMTAENSN